MSVKIIDFTLSEVKKGNKVALVTLLSKGGSTPGTSGQVLAVSNTGETCGTVGGGKSEFAIINKALDAIKSNFSTFEFDFELKEHDMICGGRIKGYATILGYTNKLLIFGGGHVSQKLYGIAKDTEFDVKIIDDRLEFKKFFSDEDYFTKLEEIENKFSQNTYIVICTRGHHSDYEALEYCIKKEYKYLGMIGSKKKIKTLLEKLVKSGIDKSVIKSIYAPIGLKIDNGTPIEIAISIMAEILSLKNNGKLESLKNLINFEVEYEKKN